MTRTVVGAAILVGIAGVVVGVLVYPGGLSDNETNAETSERGLGFSQTWPLTDGKPSAYAWIEDPIAEAVLQVSCTYQEENTYQSFQVSLDLYPERLADFGEEGATESVGWSFSNGESGRGDWEVEFRSTVLPPQPSEFVAHLMESKEMKIRVGEHEQLTFDPRPLFTTPIQWLFDECGDLE